MGDMMQFIVFTDIALSEAGEVAKTVKDYLVRNKLIEAESQSRDEKRNINYYRDLHSAEKLVNLAAGVEIDRENGRCMGLLGLGVGWQYAHHFTGELTMACPNCDQGNDINKAFQIIQSYYDRVKPDDIECECCKERRPFNDWVFEPSMVVGHFSVNFEFWPPLKEQSICKMKNLAPGRSQYIIDKL